MAVMLSVTTGHAGGLGSVGFSLWSPEAAAFVVCAGFAEGEGTSQGWGSALGASRWAAGFVQV